MSVLPPPPPLTAAAPTPTRWRREVTRADARRLVGLALAGGIALDVGLRAGPTNLFVSLGLLAAVGMVVTTSATPAGRALGMAAAVPALFLGVWTSEWLAVLNLGAAVGLLAAGVLWSASGDPFHASVRPAVVRVLSAVGHGLLRLAGLTRHLPRPASDGAARTWRALGAVMLALPLVVALVALLASADVVFAGLVTPDLDLGDAVGHLALIGFLGGVLLLGGLSVGVEVEDREHHGPFGVLEVSVVLGLAVAVLGLFVVSQVVATTDAGQRLIEEAGLTPAEYARSGFFQLCWASVVLVTYGALARGLAAAGTFTNTTVRLLSAAVPALSLGLVVVSLNRMYLYDQTFGLTMLRLAVVVVTVWIGVVQLLLVARNLGLRADLQWVPAGAVLAAFVLTVVVNLTNPEAFVVRHNLARADAGTEVDLDYLGRLSQDAAPALLDAFDDRPTGELRNALDHAVVCDDRGVAGLNVAARRAAAARAVVCVGGD